MCDAAMAHALLLAVILLVLGYQVWWFNHL
jgi:hypothetical protein